MFERDGKYGVEHCARFPLLPRTMDYAKILEYSRYVPVAIRSLFDWTIRPFDIFQDCVRRDGATV